MNKRRLALAFALAACAGCFDSFGCSDGGPTEPSYVSEVLGDGSVIRSRTSAFDGDYGDDSGEYAFDGQSDDSRFFPTLGNENYHHLWANGEWDYRDATDTRTLH